MAAPQPAKFMRITGAEGYFGEDVNGLYEASGESLVWKQHGRAWYLYRATDGEWWINWNVNSKNERKAAGWARSVGGEAGMPTSVRQWRVDTEPDVSKKAKWQKQELRVRMHMCVGVCIDIRMDMCTDMHMDMCIDMCVDMCVDM